MGQIGTRRGEDKVDNVFVMSDARTRVLNILDLRMNVHSQFFKAKILRRSSGALKASVRQRDLPAARATRI